MGSSADWLGLLWLQTFTIRMILWTRLRLIPQREMKASAGRID